jgi:AcrR family transcriptional regulator
VADGLTAAKLPAPRKRRDAELNRERVLAAAVTAVFRDGPRVPLATVAAEAGVGIATLYRSFATRDALLDALAQRAFSVLLESAQLAELSLATGRECVGQFLDGALAHRGELVLPLHVGELVLSEQTVLARRQLHRVLQKLLKRGHADGTIRPDAGVADVILFGAMLTQRQPEAGDMLRTSRRIKDIYLDGLGRQ